MSFLGETDDDPTSQNWVYDDTDQEIVDMYAEDEYTMAEEVSDKLGIPLSAAVERRGQLVDRGYLEQEWDGRGSAYHPSH